MIKEMPISIASGTQCIRQPELEDEDLLPSGTVMRLHRAVPLSVFQRCTGHSTCLLPLSHGRPHDKLVAGGRGEGGGGGTENLPTKFCYKIVTVFLILIPL